MNDKFFKENMRILKEQLNESGKLSSEILTTIKNVEYNAKEIADSEREFRRENVKLRNVQSGLMDIINDLVVG